MSGDRVDPVRIADEIASFETSLSRLEDVVSTLEKGGVTLQRSMELFEEGMRLIERLQRVLEFAESRIDELVQSAEGTLETRPFEATR
ncbi:exodeoxyribonuclease VII small subunit [Candidatus Fermentibacteria bacterium]|nr:exodeoxyribonuclease VII small subunit [Candidatus Fermentibacteria bacterium]